MNMATLINAVDQADKEITLWMNFDGGTFADAIWWTFSSRLIWIIPAVGFLYYLYYRHCRLSTAIIIMTGLILTVVACDQISASVFKPFFMRLRPSHVETLSQSLHTVYGYKGGLYGFVSSHATNTFGTFAYASLLIRRRLTTVILLIFSLCVCYSRIYLGVHYLGDVIAGAMLGASTGCLMYLSTMVFNDKIIHILSDIRKPVKVKPATTTGRLLYKLKSDM